MKKAKIWDIQKVDPREYSGLLYADDLSPEMQLEIYARGIFENKLPATIIIGPGPVVQGIKVIPGLDIMEEIDVELVEERINALIAEEEAWERWGY